MLITKNDRIQPISNPPSLSIIEDNPNVNIDKSDLTGLANRFEITIVIDIKTK